jgi:serine O-acetyltransferase
MERYFRFKFLFSLFRRLFIQCSYNVVLNPDSFRSINAIVSLKLPHPYFIVIHKEVSIGDNCRIYQGVTIGSTEKQGEHHNLAYIGDNVLIGVKSTILGGVKIGNNAKIGAHALVLKDVEEGKTAVGLWK